MTANLALNPLLGVRENPKFVFWLMDAQDRRIADVSDWVESGDLTLSTDRLGGSGSITITDPGIDWMSHRLQIVYDPGA